MKAETNPDSRLRPLGQSEWITTRHHSKSYFCSRLQRRSYVSYSLAVGLVETYHLLMGLIIAMLLLTSNPALGSTNQPRQTAKVCVSATGYCLPGTMTSGVITQVGHAKARGQGRKGCLALSRKLAKDLGLHNGSTYNYKFGTIIVIEGSNGYDGEYEFMDLMPPKWDRHKNGYRIDIYFPTVNQCYTFGVKNLKLYVKEVRSDWRSS